MYPTLHPISHYPSGPNLPWMFVPHSFPPLNCYGQQLPAGITQNGPFPGPRRSPFGPQQSPRHSGNNAPAGVGRFPPFGFQQQRQQLRPGLKSGNQVYGYDF